MREGPNIHCLVADIGNVHATFKLFKVDLKRPWLLSSGLDRGGGMGEDAGGRTRDTHSRLEIDEEGTGVSTWGHCRVIGESTPISWKGHVSIDRFSGLL